MPKFFIKQEQMKQDDLLTIGGEDVKHIKDVLRFKKEEIVQVCNTSKRENYECKICQITDQEITCQIVRRIEAEAEPLNEIVVYQALPKQEKMEWILQKATELGMYKMVPIQTKRCIVKFDEKTAYRKVERWQKIIESAAKQSGRDSIPKIELPKTIDKIKEEIEDYDLFLVAYEKEQNQTLKQELKKQKSGQNKIAILIGPEGGLEEEEVEILRKKGAKVITLGKRILRTETVALHMISNILYELEG